MLAQRTRVLISYHDGANPFSERDSMIANHVANYLRNQGVEPEIRGYRNFVADVTAYQWLILVSSSLEVLRSSPIALTVDHVLKQVVDRDLSGVLLVTTNPADSLELWPTIRKYDASNQDELPEMLEGIGSAIQSAKKPYIAPPAPVSRWSQVAAILPPVRSSNLHLSIKPATLLIAILCTILLSGGAVTYLAIRPLSPAPTPTIAAHKLTPPQATATALAVTRQAYQTLYNDIVGKQAPTIVGFRKDENWDSSKTCAFDPHKAYHAKISQAQANTYIVCMAQKSNLADFAYQVALTIQGDAGGLIFRSNNGSYYRFALSTNAQDPTNDAFHLYLCTPDLCTSNTINQGMLVCDGGNVVAQPNQPVTMTVIAQGTTIDLYLNQQFVCQAKNTSTVPLAGAIGIYAASLGNDTDVMASNVQVWTLSNCSLSHGRAGINPCTSMVRSSG